ncbi:MAG: SAM-dependent methyltransferase, partial [Gammaproteobacteria bacterium]
EPGAAAKAHSAKLCARIRRQLAREGGWMCFARFMAEALYAPKLGYYAAGRAHFGARGDFVTAPQLGGVTAHCLAAQCAEALAEIGGGDVLEFGAGSGQLAADMLTAMDALGAAPRRYCIIETSAALRARQRGTIARSGHAGRVRWLARPPRAFDGVAFANEVLDAMPAMRFEVDARGRAMALGVGVDDAGRFAWARGAELPARLQRRLGLGGVDGGGGEGGEIDESGESGVIGKVGATGEFRAAGEIGGSGNAGEIGNVGAAGETGKGDGSGESGAIGKVGAARKSRVVGEGDGVGEIGGSGGVGDGGKIGEIGNAGETSESRVIGSALGQGYRSEIGLRGEEWVRDVGARIRRGVLLLLDYGFPRREFYHAERRDGTLMCHYRHIAHADPFFYPGLQDISAHIDFTAISAAACAAGLTPAGFASQGAFLLSLGALDVLGRAQREAADAREQIARAREVQTLVMPQEMGELFKVTAFTRNYAPELRGFSLHDRRGRL